MSPATKRKPGEPRTIKGEGSESVVISIESRAPQPRIKVAWLCGGGRSFDVDTLREAIAYVDTLGTKYDLWLDLKDTGGSGYWARLKDGKLTANDNMGDNGFVSWANLKRGLQATIVEVLKD